jgi:nitroreductase
MIGNILEAARWAPSGLNNQPWKFMILSKVKKDALAKYTRYSYIITSCDKLILVFLDKKASYDFEKDLMATGAAIQNMLLYVHSKNLGACWLGEILNQKKQVHRSLKIDKNLELKAAIALGYPQKRPASGKRKSLKGLLVR